MTFLVRQISHMASGREIVRDRALDKRAITVGRAAEHDIHLPDLAVAPDHARIEALDDRRIKVVATGTLGFEVDGRTTTETDIDSIKGAELTFGGHRITVAHDEAGNIVLTVQRITPLSDASEEKVEGQVFSLKGLVPPKRATAWILVALVLAAFLAVPIWSFAHRGDPDQRNIYALKAEHSWSSGPLSDAHHALEGNCEACHKKAFVSVRDDACRTCHVDVHDHAPPARMAEAREQPGLGGKMLASVARVFGKPGPGACVDCHTEHQGAGPMPPTPQAFCSDCHSSLDTRLADTKLGNAGDFGTLHPQFRPAVMAKPGADPDIKRISLAKRPQDRSGLKFPHKLHLAVDGGVARMARSLKGEQDFGDALECKDCHKPTADGVRFLPVDMERDCQMCHSLAFERIGGTVRTLPHGDVDQVIADIRAYYRSTGPVRPMELGGMRRRPGAYAKGKVSQAYSGARRVRPRRASSAIRAVFTKGGACYDCHTVTPPGTDGPSTWTVTPVHQSLRYMMHGWFDHSAHRTEDCASCHAAKQSDSATDLMLPGIKTCRTCHGGAKDSAAKVPSSCAMCHSYHARPGAPWNSRQHISWTKQALREAPYKDAEP